MSTEYELTLNDYLSILHRRAKPMLIAFFVIFAITAIVAVVIPPVYESSGTILLESSDIPTKLMPDSNQSNIETKLDVVKQRVMTRDNLFNIINKYNLFKDRDPSMTTTELLDKMQSSIDIELINSDTRSGRNGMGTIAFTVAFDYRSPDIANKVANDLVTLFLNENAKSSTEQAVETTKFLNEQATSLNAQLTSLEAQIASYKAKYSYALPENQSLRQSMLQQDLAELAGAERDYKTTQDNLSYLEIQLSSAKAGVGVGSDNSQSGANPAAQLQKLQTQYASMLGTYTADYPDVVALKHKIEALKKVVNSPLKNGKAAPAMSETDLMVAQIKAKIKAANSQLDSLDHQKRSLKKQIGQLQRGIEASPQVAAGLEPLIRDHTNVQKNYDSIQNRLAAARIQQNLQEQNKAERFTLVDPPLMPDKPIKPNRYKILALGFFLALAGSAGTAMALESLYKRVRGSDELTLILNQRPLVSIPYITTPDDLKKKSSMVKYYALAIFIAIALALMAIHFFYMPLDVLFYKIMNRFS